jgi:hypothetical protein
MIALGLPFAFFLAAATPQQLAVDYLVREVPRWAHENHCHSCHNNGDAARALFLAARRGYSVPGDALADTVQWLERPAGWDDNGGKGFSDKKLARVQFAGALTEAYAAGFVRDRRALVEAAESLAREQEPHGSWKIDTGGAPGAPATYGTALATYVSRRTLEMAGRKRFEEGIARATGWFQVLEPANVPETAALLLAGPAARSKHLPLLLRAQSSDGGWGPQSRMPSEPFDTALALLALDAAGGPAPAIARGRDWLIRQQQSAGGWPETTRPAGQQSYAEHISTTGWAAYALLATDPKRQ